MWIGPGLAGRIGTRCGSGAPADRLPSGAVAGSLVIRGGRVLAGTAWAPGDLGVVDGRLAAVGDGGPPGGRVLDASGLLVAPGFLDLQVNGGVGVDLAREPERLAELAAHLPASGVTGWCPTLVTSPPDRLAPLLAAAARPPEPGAARPLGLHLEGPVLHPTRRGAHPEHLLRAPTDVDPSGWTRAAGVALVTLAPELPGALDLVRTLRAAGVVVSAGHTDATPAQLDAAWAAGVRLVTHLCNGMPPFHHRSPGPVGWTLGHPQMVAGLIADGQHVDPVAVAALVRALGPGRTLLVSDLVAPAGTEGAGAVVRRADGVLAGGTTPLDACVRNLVAFTGCPTALAVRCVTAVPANVLGLRDRGLLRPGYAADLVLLTDDLHVVGTVVGGEPSASLADRLTSPRPSPAR